ncbi:hypothetical protein FACS1894184_05250 [Clostridia bacterium]|nr:hypothetical protein FACS1894184_05250 [Clostridia bacterium]
MREKQYAGGVVALGSLFILLMRLLSPAFRAGFDWVALGLTAVAAAGVLLPVFLPGRRGGRSAGSFSLSHESGVGETAGVSYPISLALKDRAASLGWSVPEGGVYDALIKLSRRNAHAALSGAYATLTLLLNSDTGSGRSAHSGDDDHADELGAAIQSLVRLKRAREPEATLLASLADVLDERCRADAMPIDQPSQDALLDTSLRAIAFLERVSQ